MGDARLCACPAGHLPPARAPLLRAVGVTGAWTVFSSPSPREPGGNPTRGVQAAAAAPPAERRGEGALSCPGRGQRPLLPTGETEAAGAQRRLAEVPDGKAKSRSAALPQQPQEGLRAVKVPALDCRRPPPRLGTAPLPLKMLRVLETDPGGLESRGAEMRAVGGRMELPQIGRRRQSAQLFSFRGLSSSSPSSSSLFSPSVQLFVFSDRVSDLRQEIRYLYSRRTAALMYLLQSQLRLPRGLFVTCRLFCDEGKRALFSLGIFPPPFNTMQLLIKQGNTHASLPTGPLPSASPTLKYQPFTGRESLVLNFPIS